MQLEKLLEKATPRPWEEGARTHMYVDIPPNFPPFDAISISNGAKGLQIAIFPLDESSRENAMLVLHIVNKFEPLLQAAKAVLPYLPCGDYLNKEHAKSAQELREAIKQAEEV